MSEKTGIEWNRVVASNGYILLRVGKNHPLSDCRGYAYEHRVVAEKKIGRPLKCGELVHHLDGNKQNNHEDNLEVVESIAAHLGKHRNVSSNLRKHDEENPMIACACGCMSVFRKYDSVGRPRRYVSGHNTRCEGGRYG